MTILFYTYDYRGERVMFDKWENVQFIPRNGEFIKFDIWNQGKDETIYREVKEVAWMDQNTVSVLVNF